MLVAFESLTNRTPPISATSSSACSSPWNCSTARANGRRGNAGQPRRRRGRHDVGHQVRPNQPDRRQRKQGFVGPVRSPVHDVSAGNAEPRLRRLVQAERHQPPALAAAPRARRSRSSALTMAMSSARWLAKMRAFASRYSVSDACRSRWSAREVQPEGHPGPERDTRLQLETAGLHHVHGVGVESSICPLSAGPRLPPVQRAQPAASHIGPISVVVVDLPFVPVIAMMRPFRNRHANSSSPMTGTPAKPRGLHDRQPRRHARD